MGWEKVAVGGSHRSGPPLGPDEVSIIETKNGNSLLHRINFRASILPDGCKAVTLNIDKKRKRLGFFKAEEGYERRVISYNRQRSLVYVSIPKTIVALGFRRGRFKIFRGNAKAPDNLHFYIKGMTKSEKDEPKKE